MFPTMIPHVTRLELPLAQTAYSDIVSLYTGDMATFLPRMKLKYCHEK